LCHTPELERSDKGPNLSEFLFECLEDRYGDVDVMEINKENKCDGKSQDLDKRKDEKDNRCVTTKKDQSGDQSRKHPMQLRDTTLNK